MLIFRSFVIDNHFEVCSSESLLAVFFWLCWIRQILGGGGETRYGPSELVNHLVFQSFIFASFFSSLPAVLHLRATSDSSCSTDSWTTSGRD